MYVQQYRLGICRLVITSFVFRQFRASCKVIRIPKSSKFLLGKFGILGIKLEESGIQLTIGNKNTSCTDKNRESVTEIRSLWRGIQNLAVVWRGYTQTSLSEQEIVPSWPNTSIYSISVPGGVTSSDN